MQDTKEQSFEKIMEYEKKIHEKNQQRIKIGIRLVIIIPLIFLTVMFKLDSSKVVFLVLWIVSLFAISLYLIVVEYMDYNLQEKIMELKGEEGDIEAVTPTDFDRAAQIIRETRKMIGAGLNSPAETEKTDEHEDGEDGE